MKNVYLNFLMYGIKVSPSPCKRVPEKILSPEKAFVSYSYMELRLPEKLG